VDLFVFGIFSTLTVLLLPAGIIEIWRVFNPALGLSDVTATDQILLQGVVDLVIVGFVAFLIKVVHGLPFLRTIHWFKNYPYRKGFLILLGITLAISVSVISSRFPSKEASPLEKLLSSNRAMYAFAILGVAVAPLLEEVVFRGFLFKVLSDIGGAVIAVLVTAISFGAVHALQLWGNWVGVLLIFVVGFVLSFVRHRSNSLIPSFIIHTAYNSTFLGAFLLGTLLQKAVH
jgi:membrane protease YdiL (CAAX protease family)